MTTSDHTHLWKVDKCIKHWQIAFARDTEDLIDLLPTQDLSEHLSTSQNSF